eukprot:1202096-Prymnesium_polylepis.1
MSGKLKVGSTFVHWGAWSGRIEEAPPPLSLGRALPLECRGMGSRNLNGLFSRRRTRKTH